VGVFSVKVDTAAASGTEITADAVLYDDASGSSASITTIVK
jgi:hypothetical protein